MQHLFKPWVGFTALVLGAVLIGIGLMLLADVGELTDRTEQSVATIQDGTFSFTTIDGVGYSLPLKENCKRAEPTPRRGCLEFYENGDEVLVWYDAADPAHTWQGATPGGGMATVVLYGGIVLATFAFVALYFLYVLPRIKVALAFVGDIARRGPERRG